MSCCGCSKLTQDAHIIGYPSVGCNLLVVSVYGFPIAPLVSVVRSIAVVISGEGTVIGIINFLRIRYDRVENLGGIDF